MAEAQRQRWKHFFKVLAWISVIIGIPAGLITIIDRGPSLAGCVNARKQEKPHPPATARNYAATPTTRGQSGRLPTAELLGPTKILPQVVDGRLAEFRNLVNTAAIPKTEKKRLALAVQTSGQGDGSVEEVLTNAIQAEDVVLVPGYFKKPFRTSTFFDEVYSGDNKLLNDIGRLSAIDGIFLGKQTISYADASDLDPDLVSCHLELQYRVIDRHGAVITADAVSVVGPGFSQQTARQQAYRRLAERVGPSILQAVQ